MSSPHKQEGRKPAGSEKKPPGWHLNLTRSLADVWGIRPDTTTKWGAAPRRSGLPYAGKEGRHKAPKL